MPHFATTFAADLAGTARGSTYGADCGPNEELIAARTRRPTSDDRGDAPATRADRGAGASPPARRATTGAGPARASAWCAHFSDDSTPTAHAAARDAFSGAVELAGEVAVLRPLTPLGCQLKLSTNLRSMPEHDLFANSGACAGRWKSCSSSSSSARPRPAPGPLSPRRRRRLHIGHAARGRRRRAGRRRDRRTGARIQGRALILAGARGPPRYRARSTAGQDRARRFRRDRGARRRHTRRARRARYEDGMLRVELRWPARGPAPRAVRSELPARKSDRRRGPRRRAPVIAVGARAGAPRAGRGVPLRDRSSPTC